MRVAMYARFSTDKQEEASIDDQLRICEEYARKEGWTVVGTYCDRAISGASLLRAGVQALLKDAQAGKFDVILCEALDRLSRDQEDIAGVYKRMQFAGVKMITLGEGEISTIHIGLKGTMNALFLKDLADKVRRGLRGRIENGKSGGGLTYGYDVVRRIDPTSEEYVRGERAINKKQAAIVRRIFTEYSEGHSPRSIAMRLNKEGIKGPAGHGWGPSTIYGNRDRGTGILNNELYIGRVVWNRLRYVKNPDTGKRQSRLNPEKNWIIKDAPDLRIIEQDLWDAVKEKQGEINKHDTPLWQKNRPKHLLSGLIKCGCCGGGCSMVGVKSLGCSTARNKGTCSNRLTHSRADLEQAVCAALTKHLMDERLCAEFCAEYVRRMNELRSQHNSSLSTYRAEYAKLERERQQIIKSIADGVPGSLLKDRATAVQARREELERLLAERRDDPIIFHPSMAARYHQEVRTLIVSLSNEETRPEASTVIRSLIDRIVLTPTAEGDRLTVDLVGDLAGILSIATKHDKSAITTELSKLQPVQQDGVFANPESPDTEDFCGSMALVAGNRTGRPLHSQEAVVAGDRVRRDLHSQEAMVAGAGFEPATFRL